MTAYCDEASFLVYTWDIAKYLEVTERTVRYKWLKDPLFPTAVAKTVFGPLWDAEQVVEWYTTKSIGVSARVDAVRARSRMRAVS